MKHTNNFPSDIPIFRVADSMMNKDLPLAVSPDNITQSAPSKTALATSVASARVERGLSVMLSSIW